jgi:hypothetical protein
MSVLTLLEAMRRSWTMTLLRTVTAADCPIDGVAAVCEASRRLFPDKAFDLFVEGERTVSIEPTEAALRARLLRGPSTYLTLSTSEDPRAALSFHRDPLSSPPADLVRITVQENTVLPTLLWRWLATAASSYHAEVAWLDTYMLKVLAGEGHRRKMEESEAPDMREFLPPPDEWVRQFPAVAERFAHSVVQDGDRGAVPESVWWANVWSWDVVARVGQARIDAAPWHLVEPIPGGLLLVACADPPDAEHPKAVDAIADILVNLDLPARAASAVQAPPNGGRS